MRIRAMLCVVCVCGLIAVASGAPPLTEHLPSGTLVYVGWAGTGLAFDGSGVGQLLSSPGVAEVLGAIRKMGRTKLGEDQVELFDHAWELGAVAWHSPVGVALTDLAITPQGVVPSVAVLIRPGRDRDAFAKHLDAIVQSIAPDGESVVAVKVGEVTYRKIKGPPEIGDISFGFLDDVFFVAIGPETARQLIEVSPEKSLGGSKKFMECWKPVGGENEQLAFYIDIPVLLERIDALFSPTPPGGAAPQTQSVSPLRRAVEAMAVDKVTAIAGCTRIVDRGMYTKVRLFTPAPHSGLLSPLSGAPLSDADLAGVPEDADFVAAVRLSPESLWTEIRQIARRFSLEAENDLLRNLARIEKDLDVSLAEDILPALGDTIVLSSAPSQGGFLTGTLLSVSVKDPPKLNAAIAKIEEFITKSFPPDEDGSGGATIDTLKVGRAEIRYLSMPGRLPPFVAPGWTVHKDRLYLAAWPQVIASAIENNGVVKPLTAEPVFRKARARVSPKASIVCYVNTPKIIRQVYHWTLIGWTIGANAIAGNTPVRANPGWLPALSTLEKHIWAEISAVSADEGGITFEGYGSTPAMGAAFMPLASPLSVAVLMPALSSARRQAKHAVSRSNLRTLALAVFLYQEDHDGKSPKDLTDVLDTGSGGYLANTSPLVSPFSGRDPPAFVDGKLVGEIDYVFLGIDPRAAEPHIIIYERPELHGGEGTNAAFSDGRVEWLAAPDFQRELERAKNVLKAAVQPAADDSAF